jgi:hypothetical protein
MGMRYTQEHAEIQMRAESLLLIAHCSSIIVAAISPNFLSPPKTKVDPDMIIPTNNTNRDGSQIVPGQYQRLECVQVRNFSRKLDKFVVRKIKTL